MKYPTIFHLISSIADETRIRCVLIGGFAVNYYKVTRQTADVDFLITKDDFEKILSLLEKEGFIQDYTQEVFTKLKCNRVNLMDLDFMFVDKETLDKIIKEGKQISIAGQKFIVPSLFHLIALKLHAIKYNPKIREYKDFLDIIELILQRSTNSAIHGGVEYSRLSIPPLREPRALALGGSIRVNKVKVKSSKFRQMCLKYGTEELYNKILDRI